MHMADALVAPAVAGTMYVASAVTAGYSVKRVGFSENSQKVPLMGVMGAFVFAAQMINFTIPGTGASGHLTGGMLLSALLGPCAGFLTMVGVLLIQCLLFADGGLMALGCNIWNMAFYGCFFGAGVIWRFLMRGGVSKKRITAASILGAVLTLQLGAFSVVLETSLSGVTKLPFLVFAGAMQPIHLAIGLVEGVVTATVLCFVYEARPELLWTGKNIAQAGNEFAGEKLADGKSGTGKKQGRLSYKKTLGILGIFAVVIAGVLSLLASAFPDGLEWSVARVTGASELSAEGGIYRLAANIQKMTALLPDYAFQNSDSAAGTSFSGIVGGVVVLTVLLGICRLCKMLGTKSGKP